MSESVSGRAPAGVPLWVRSRYRHRGLRGRKVPSRSSPAVRRVLRLPEGRRDGPTGRHLGTTVWRGPEDEVAGGAASGETTGDDGSEPRAVSGERRRAGEGPAEEYPEVRGRVGPVGPDVRWPRVRGPRVVLGWTRGGSWEPVGLDAWAVGGRCVCDPVPQWDLRGTGG